jgi:hypothetical protein
VATDLHNLEFEILHISILEGPLWSDIKQHIPITAEPKTWDELLEFMTLPSKSNLSKNHPAKMGRRRQSASLLKGLPAQVAITNPIHPKAILSEE